MFSWGNWINLISVIFVLNNCFIILYKQFQKMIWISEKSFRLCILNIYSFFTEIRVKFLAAAMQEFQLKNIRLKFTLSWLTFKESWPIKRRVLKKSSVGAQLMQILRQISIFVEYTKKMIILNIVQEQNLDIEQRKIWCI